VVPAPTLAGPMQVMVRLNPPAAEARNYISAMWLNFSLRNLLNLVSGH
jgi:hypothetical protein